MSYHQIPLLAGVPFRLDIPGRLLLIDDAGAAGGVDVALIESGTARATMSNRKAGFRIVDKFDGVMFTASSNSTVGFFIAVEDVQLGTNQLEITNSPANPVNVLFAGTVEPVIGTINNSTDAQAIPVRQVQAQTVTNVAPAAVTAVAAVILAAVASRKGIRLRNVGAEPVAIGGAGVTFANAAMIIQAGETWIENEAAPAAWSAICAAGTASTLNIQTIA